MSVRDDFGLTRAYDPPIDATPEELRLIADSAPVAVWMMGPDRKRSFVNRAYAEFMGLPFGQALATDWCERLHPEDSDRVLAELRAGEASRRPFHVLARYRRADGVWRWLETTLQPRFDATGEPLGFVGVAHDMTESKETELALRERDAQFSAFIGQSTAGFGQVDLGGRFTLVNDRFCEISGWSREELIGRSAVDITHPDDAPRSWKNFADAVAHGTPYTQEKRYVRKDGGIVWVHNSVSLLRRPDGEPFGLLAVTLDVTQRREDEAARRKSEESIRLAVEGTGMVTWELDEQAHIGEWSPNGFDLVGLPRPADLRCSFAELLALIHPEDSARLIAAAQACFTEGAPYTIEYRIRRADTGEERWIQSHGSRIEPRGDAPARHVGVSFDITARKRAEERLRASEERYRTIFEQANDFLVTSDLHHKITAVNPAVLAALGYREDEVLGRSIAEFLDPDQYAVAHDALEKKLASGGTTRLAVDIATRDGEKMHWEVSSRLIQGADGAPTGVLSISRDVTEAKRAEAHQQLLIDELNHRVKNTLAIVQGIAQQTFKPGVDAKPARAAFEGRLAALAGAHTLLTRQHWGPVSMFRIIHEAAAAHGGDSGRFAISGPTLMISPKTAISLALAIHELATNAVKHGALSTPEGCVTIDWQVEEAKGGSRLALRWAEHGGPPVTRPASRGFGTRMIERGLASELEGKVQIDFAPTGLVCTLNAPLPKLVE